ncbi:hypothetical protein E2P81_ATG09510 [Venturia nashicola]|nr:hypothetical protein E2P81_ATG09510 [Venturia nashicola]
MSSTLTLKNSQVFLQAEQNPRARERSRLPQERRFYQVNALPNLLSPQHKPPDFSQIEAPKHVEISATASPLWKRLSAPGNFSTRSSWSSGELLSISKQNTTQNGEEKRPKGSGLSELIKHFLSPKQSTKGQPDHSLQQPMPKPEPEPEIQTDQRQSHSLEMQLAEFRTTPFRVTPMSELALLEASASQPDSNSLRLSEIRPSTSLFNLTEGFNDPDSRPATASTIPFIEERMSASQPLPDRRAVPNFSMKGSAWTARQFEPYKPENRATSPFDANASEDVVLDSIVDFFESFGVGFCRTDLEEDTFGIRSPADIESINKPRASRQQGVAKTARPLHWDQNLSTIRPI